MFQEFKKFIMRGNVVDLAIAVVIGAAFTNIVNSLVSDIINPILGAVTGGLNFSDYYINLSGQPYPSFTAAKEAGAPIIGYGAFVTAMINFLIIALVLFLVLRAYNRFIGKPAAAPPPEPSQQEKLLAEIRDLLKERRP